MSTKKWSRERIDEARKDQGRPDPDSGEWAISGSFHQEFYAKPEATLTKLLVQVVSQNSEFKSILDSMVHFNRYPRTIVSEDASGRIVARVIQLFLNLVQRSQSSAQERNIAVISYPVGRGNSRILADESARKVVNIIRKRALDNEPVIFVTDVISTGESFLPFYNEFVRANTTDRRDGESVSQPRVILFTSGIPLDFSDKFPEVGKSILVINFGPESSDVDMYASRAKALVPVSRHHKSAEAERRGALIPIETQDEARVRRGMQERIARAMFNEYTRQK